MREMKLFVCYGTFSPQTHPCGNAYKALADAGHAPEVVKTYGATALTRSSPGGGE
jgi:hypothetical protein